MKLRVLTFSILAAGSLAFSAGSLAQPKPASPAGNTPQSEMSQTGTAESSAATGTAGQTTGTAGQTQLERTDRNFLENAAQSGHAELEGSRLAQTKARSPEVKAFAEQMIQDHTMVNQELVALAQQKGYTPPTEPSLLQQAELKALSITDDAFDTTYASRIGVAAHENAVELFREGAAQANDPDIKAFAAKHLPALEQHLEMARALEQKVDAKQQ